MKTLKDKKDLMVKIRGGAYYPYIVQEAIKDSIFTPLVKEIQEIFKEVQEHNGDKFIFEIFYNTLAFHTLKNIEIDYEIRIEKKDELPSKSFLSVQGYNVYFTTMKGFLNSIGNFVDRGTMQLMIDVYNKKKILKNLLPISTEDDLEPLVEQGAMGFTCIQNKLGTYNRGLNFLVEPKKEILKKIKEIEDNDSIKVIRHPMEVYEKFFNGLGHEFGENFESNGWQVDFWYYFTLEDVNYCLCGSFWYGKYYTLRRA